MGLTRRAFVQQVSLALGALGVGGVMRLPGPRHYYQALAKPARRKLALLIGINQYSERSIDPILAQDVILKGCLTDVELQRQLLVHRFGFQPVDVVTLTNQQATRAGILEALEEHLVQQAQGDDVVLLHFSGYGSQVRLEDDLSQPQRAWVAVDSRLPSEEKPALTDLLEVEVATQLRRVASPYLTTVIDAGNQDAGYLRWGNLRVRSRPTVPTGSLPPNFAGHLTTLAGGDPIWPGLVFRAGEMGNLVLEDQWDGFSAGLLTYALTQSLWETRNPIDPEGLLQRLETQISQWTGPDQRPLLAGSLVAKASTTNYFLPAPGPAADGVILTAGGGERPLSLWLGGVPPLVLPYLQPGSRLVAGPPPGPGSLGLESGDGTVELRLESRTGLRATARPVDGAVAPLLTSAQPVYEKVRLLPQGIALVVALDGQLKRVERVDATSALASLPFVAAISMGEKKADCLFGRLPLGPTPTLTAALPNTSESDVWPKPGQERPPESSYGLFAPNRTLIPGTMLTKEEAVKTAITRLTPQLRSRLALKLVRLTENRTASWLGASATLEAVQPKPKPLLRQQTERSGLNPASSGYRETGDTIALARNTRLLYRVTNQSDRPLYLLVIAFHNTGDCFSLVPGRAPDSPLGEASLPPLAPRQSCPIPSAPNGWDIPGQVTSVDTYLILSVRPFQRCLAELTGDGAVLPLQTDLRRVNQPLKLAQAILQDLHSEGADGEGKGGTGDSFALRQDEWVTFRFNYTANPA